MLPNPNRYVDSGPSPRAAREQAVTDRSRMVDGVPTSLADLGFKDVGLDAGFEDCNARKVKCASVAAAALPSPP